jgi:23S rRNA pseudouridine955/2504/2580 synthase
MTQARTFIVGEDDDGIRLDRWFRRNQPDITFTLVARWARTGQLRLDGKRVAPGERIAAGQEIRVPPVEPEAERPARAKPRRDPLTAEEVEFVRSLVIYQDEHAFVLNKPPGLATQGGTKTTNHLDRLLDGLADESGNRPKLVHRLDKDTSGALLVARTARAAAFFSRAFSERTAKKSIGRWRSRFRRWRKG